MAERHDTRPTPVWLGPQAVGDAPVGAAEPFAEDRMWIGEHVGDGDTLVFDPAESDSSADRLRFYSLNQLRVRVFSRAVVEQQIRALTDDIRAARARQDYRRRAELREAREAEQAAARVDQGERQRQQAIDRHARYLAAQDIPYQGVRPTPSERRATRRVKCHVCGIGLDDFAVSVCGVCSEVLCSCGACACASRGWGK